MKFSTLPISRRLRMRSYESGNGSQWRKFMPLLQTSIARQAAKLTTCLLVSAWATASAGQTGGGNSVCTRTTNAGTKGCMNSANATFALALGTCANITNHAEKAKCVAQAQKRLGADRNFC